MPPLKFVLNPLTQNPGSMAVSTSLSVQAVSGPISFAPGSRMGSGRLYYGLEQPNHLVIGVWTKIPSYVPIMLGYCI